jgi:hypothetical protein
MPSEDARDDFGRVAFIDLEASGLGSNSFPTELGWAMIHEGGSVGSASCLIRPPPKWTLYANAWSAASERLTGITQEMLDQEGLPPGEAMKKLLAAVGERELFSDEPEFDAYWLGMLAEAASVPAPKIRHAKSLIEKTRSDEQPEMGVTRPHHRAEADARKMALAFASARTVEP